MNPNAAAATVDAEAETVRERVYLHPGHSIVSATPTLVTTILGSCVSVCLYDDGTAWVKYVEKR